MKSIKSFPPNIAAIAAVFPAAMNVGVLFAWGDSIFNPSGIEIPPELMAHEKIHGDRQLAMGVEAWWDRYLKDPDFRYEEELVAHRAEYQHICATMSRQQRRYYLAQIAKRLSSPLYGRMTTLERAKKDIAA